MKPIEEIICVARTAEYAFFLNEFNEFKVMEDKEQILTAGDYCTDESVLLSISELDEPYKTQIMNFIS